jgi:hypothetical protein
MDLADFEQFKKAMERLQSETEAFSRKMQIEHRKLARKRKAAGPSSPRELAERAERLAKESGEMLRLSRAKQALRLRRERALNRAQRTAGSKAST